MCAILVADEPGPKRTDPEIEALTRSLGAENATALIKILDRYKAEATVRADSAIQVNGRLTLTAGTPVTTSNVTAASTIYFTPYNGNKIALYSGTIWQLLNFSETSVAVPAATSLPFDIFAYNNGGTLALETTAWASTTARDTALTTQDGIYVRSGAATRRYLGTACTTGVANQTEDSTTNRLLWNQYNRVRRYMTITDAVSSHVYTTNAWRAWNGSSTSTAVNFMVGLVEDSVWFGAGGDIVNNYVGAALNGTAAAGYSDNAQIVGGAQNRRSSYSATYPRLGYNTVLCVEFGIGSGVGGVCQTVAEVSQ